MSEPNIDDTEGHVKMREDEAENLEADDAEGHGFKREDEDDTEGHGFKRA